MMLDMQQLNQAINDIYTCSQRMEVDDSLYKCIHQEFNSYSLDDLGKMAIKAVLRKQ